MVKMRRPLPVAVKMRKRSRLITIGKVVSLAAYGYKRPVLAIPYRHRRAVRDVISLPLAVINFADRCNVEWAIVRFDPERRDVRMRLGDIVATGWPRATEAGTELFVPLDGFQPCPYPEWPFVETVVVLDPAFDPGLAMAAGQLKMEV